MSSETPSSPARRMSISGVARIIFAETDTTDRLLQNQRIV
jgi:hypothetical protein